MMGKKNSVSIKNKIYYCLPDIPLILISTIVSYHLIYFCTDVYLLPAHVISIMFLVFNIFDAVNDYCIAYIMTKVHSRYGVYRPYILWTALPLAITSVLLFTTPDFSKKGKIIYFVLVYFSWDVIYSFFSVAREALLPVMAKTESARVSLNSLRIGFTIVLMTLCTSYLLPMVNFFGGGNQRLGFFLTALILSAVSLPVQLLAFKKIKEPSSVKKGKPTSFWWVFTTVLKDKCTAAILLMFGCYWIGNTFRNQSITHYLTYVIEKPEYVTVFIFSSMAASFSMQFFFKHLIKVAKTSTLVMIGLLGSVVSTLLIFAAGSSFYALIFTNILYGITSALPSNLIFIILAKRVDSLSERYPLDFAALLYSMMSFFKKVGTGIGGAILAWILALVNYIPNVSQSKTAALGITFNFVGGTALALFLAIIFMICYLKFEKEGDSIV